MSEQVGTVTWINGPVIRAAGHAMLACLSSWKSARSISSVK